MATIFVRKKTSSGRPSWVRFSNIKRTSRTEYVPTHKNSCRIENRPIDIKTYISLNVTYRNISIINMQGTQTSQLSSLDTDRYKNLYIFDWILHTNFIRHCSIINIKNEEQRKLTIELAHLTSIDIKTCTYLIECYIPTLYVTVQSSILKMRNK